MSEQKQNSPPPDYEPIIPEMAGDGYDLPTNVISRKVDAVIRTIGQLASWFWVASIVVITANVVDRFVFGRGSIALEELSWHFFGAGMMLTLGYAVVTDDHVRVDFLRERFSLKTKTWIELLGLVVLAIPVFTILADLMVTYAFRSFESGERSAAPSGLPYRFIVKSMMPIGTIILVVAMASRALRCISYLFGLPRPIYPGQLGNGSEAPEQSNGGV